ncbi:MAG: hypothetical protein GY757_12505 [bacterium]|nr:hypothetical protein [bacterium]
MEFKEIKEEKKKMMSLVRAGGGLNDTGITVINQIGNCGSVICPCGDKIYGHGGTNDTAKNEAFGAWYRM